MHDAAKPILVLGSTGYIGARLVPRLLEAGHPVRVLVRNPAKLSGRAWGSHPRLNIVRGDLLNIESLRTAAKGCRAAYYLVHSMNPGVADFAATDRLAAENFIGVARDAGLERIIYLSGLGEDHDRLSHHLESRAEVARILQSGAVPTTVLRAAMIIGSGSASFEILRYLVERLPVMVTPRWVETLCQPIGIRNVLGYLLGCLDHPEVLGETFDIGGADVVSYRELMRLFAVEEGLAPRLIIPVPVLTPRLSSYWIHLVTPIPASLARPLAEGLSNPVICKDHRIRELIPQEVFNAQMSIRLALQRLREHQVESAWTDAGTIPPAEWSDPGDPSWAGGSIFTDARQVEVKAEPDAVWKAIIRLGGGTGWYALDTLWRLRGLLDKLVGGPGLRRGRRDPDNLNTGDALDFWRVADLDRPHRLLLVAEMKLPGKATLEFSVEPTPEGTRIIQTARFLPRGLLGLAYWWAVFPFHHFVFSGMLSGIARTSGGTILQGPEAIRNKP
jgi:uncharacterized protein YbjT (DUF2867 family)